MSIVQNLVIGELADILTKEDRMKKFFFKLLTSLRITTKSIGFKFTFKF